MTIVPRFLDIEHDRELHGPYVVQNLLEAASPYYQHAAHSTTPTCKGCPDRSTPHSWPTLSILAMWDSMDIFHALKMSWVVAQKCPRVHLKRGPVTLSTHKDSRILKSLLAFM